MDFLLQLGCKCCEEDGTAGRCCFVTPRSSSLKVHFPVVGGYVWRAPVNLFAFTMQRYEFAKWQVDLSGRKWT